jgi:hypothetical protein
MKARVRLTSGAWVYGRSIDAVISYVASRHLRISLDTLQERTGRNTWRRAN